MLFIIKQFLILFFVSYYSLPILYAFYIMEILFDKKQIWVIFKCKMGCKAVETTLNISNTFDLAQMPVSIPCSDRSELFAE